MRGWKQWTFLTIVLTLVFHVIVIYLFPYIIMAYALRRIKDYFGDQFEINRVLHFPPVQAESKLVVMPSPDLLYSICFYDVTKNPLQIMATVPSDTYWSLSVYEPNTDNFFVVNDQQVTSNQEEIILIGPNTFYSQGSKEKVVVSPSNKGVIFFRIFIKNNDELHNLVQIQRKTFCRLMD